MGSNPFSAIIERFEGKTSSLLLVFFALYEIVSLKIFSEIKIEYLKKSEVSRIDSTAEFEKKLSKSFLDYHCIFDKYFIDTLL